MDGSNICLAAHSLSFLTRGDLLKLRLWDPLRELLYRRGPPLAHQRDVKHRMCVGDQRNIAGTKPLVVTFTYYQILVQKNTPPQSSSTVRS
jgi:hypothetical protein